MRLRLLTLMTATALTLGACGDDEETPVADTPPAAATTPAASTPAATTPPPAETEEVEVKKGECADVPAAAPKPADTPEPSGSLPTDVRNILTLKTSCGEIKIELDAEKNPKTANSMATLAKAGYYDGLSFHRTVQGFVVQGGDPAGNGSGGPSWKVVEKPADDAKYTEGVVAMAKTGTEAPGTSGSQFFIVTASDVGLPPEYAIAGKVVKGQDIANLISEQGTEGQDGPPKKPVVIFSATLDTKAK
ncbi:MAG: peptidylprolyl isomerase [Solirubrobacteraceae bacterium]|nr:peptidylprolyl isomerase [Solirubrobacteraceae bacterium]